MQNRWFPYMEILDCFLEVICCLDAVLMLFKALIQTIMKIFQVVLDFLHLIVELLVVGCIPQMDISAKEQTTDGIPSPSQSIVLFLWTCSEN